MTTQAFYPVFEAGQVLTSEQLNDIVDYLEPQDRSTRNRLIGIGIVCGLQPGWNPATQMLTISRGAAVTSEGYLIAEDEVVYDRVRPYAVPVPTSAAASPAAKAEARYPFLFDGETQRPAHELLPVGDQGAPGETAATALNDAAVADACVMLFLERSLTALRNCDIQDCSDRGAAMNLTVRRLLVPRSVADTILEQEATIAKRPIDRAAHPRLDLRPLTIEKVNPAGYQIDSLAALYRRLLDVAGAAGQQLLPALREVYAAYQPLLEDMFPASSFPDGPFPRHHFFNLLAAFAETPPLAQYLHGAMHDMIRSHDELLACAARFDSECCPAAGRFPRHVLAGDVAILQTAFAGAPRSAAAYARYDPRVAVGGPAPDAVPAARRHHFVPSPATGTAADTVEELRALFARTVLLAQTYATKGLLGTEIGLTPSRGGAAPLGERAIPFYYGFEPGGDLFLNWSWRKTRTGRTDALFSHRSSVASADHPLLFRHDEQDFIRIEGIVGKPLGTAMGNLISQRAALGLAFAIEPVWIGSGADPRSEEAARALARRAMERLLLCRMRDLDVLFLAIMSGLFGFAVWLVRLLGRIDGTKVTAPGVAAPPPAIGVIQPPPVFGVSLLRLDPGAERQLRAESARTLTELRTGTLRPEALIGTVAAGERPLHEASVASLYGKVRDAAIGGELIERVRTLAAELAEAGDRDRLVAGLYPAVALMARAEELMQATSASSLAEFDETRFTTAVRGLADAFERYAAVAETDPARVPREIATVNAALLAQRGVVAAAGSQFSGGAIMTELGTRLEAMFDDMTLAGYARRHPGLEHAAGVPVGGTFVLLYGSRTEVEAGLGQVLAGLGDGFAGHVERLTGGRVPALADARALRELLVSSAPQSDDVLDEFIVLGDFYLPYRTGGTECTEHEVERRIVRREGVVRPADPRAERPTGPTPGRDPVVPPGPREPVARDRAVVEITIDPPEVFDRQTVRLVVTHRASRRKTEFVLRLPFERHEVPPGDYRAEAFAVGFRSPAVDVTLEAGVVTPVRLRLS